MSSLSNLKDKWGLRFIILPGFRVLDVVAAFDTFETCFAIRLSRVRFVIVEI
jgi:hypothetical protein